MTEPSSFESTEQVNKIKFFVQESEALKDIRAYLILCISQIENCKVLLFLYFVLLYSDIGI